MNHASPIMRNFAQCLIAREGDTDWPAFNFPLTEYQATLGIVEKLRPQLEELLGETGFRALLMNALGCAQDEAPWLGEARMNPDGSFEGFEQDPMLTDSEKVSKGGAVMLAWFLGLLTASIGELLTIQLVLEVWPDLSLNERFSEASESLSEPLAQPTPWQFAQYYEN